MCELPALDLPSLTSSKQVAAVGGNKLILRLLPCEKSNAESTTANHEASTCEFDGGPGGLTQQQHDVLS